MEEIIQNGGKAHVVGIDAEKEGIKSLNSITMSALKQDAP